MPTSLTSCPVPADQFTGKRITKWLDPRGGVGSLVDKWLGTRTPADRVHMKKWKGSTHVEYKEGYDVLAPKRKEFEEPPEPTTKKKRATREPKERRGRDKPESSTSSTPSATPGPTTSQRAAGVADIGDRPEPATSSTPSATPGASSDFRPEVFSLTEADKSANLDDETILLVKKRIEQLQNDTDQGIKLNSLRMEIHRLRQEEKDLIKAIRRACENQEEAMVIEFDVEDLQAFVASGATYAKNKMASNKEVNYRKLGHADRKRMDEAMAREISEVLRSQALKAASEGLSEEEVKDRIIPMRWILTWKPVPDGQPPRSSENEVSSADGKSKAKARVVLIGYKHPDLARRNTRTGQPELLTASPTLSRLGRNMLLQAAAFDKHTVECADAKSAFLQADQGIGADQLFTRGVPELAMALGLTPGALMEVVGAVYGLTNAPRIFWLDVDAKMRSLGGRPRDIDRCLWIFKNRSGKVIGRVGTHVDDFIISGDRGDAEFMALREKIRGMYAWSPWRTGSFTFAGLEIRQMKNFEIQVTQETYCNTLVPIEIDKDKSRGDSAPLTPKEISQYRGLIMKAQWRAVQTAFQYAARVGIAASAVNQATLSNLREANSLMKELRKTAKEDLVFHSFNYNREMDLTWDQMVAVHFGDAGHNNRPDGGATGGYITGFSDQGGEDERHGLAILESG